MRRLLPLSLLALTAAGCERMPEDPVFAYGRLLHGDGAPHGGAAVRVERTLLRDSWDYGVEQTVRDFQPYSEGRSEATGDYTLAFLHGEVVEEDNLNYTFTQYGFRAYAPLEEDGSGVFVSFSFRDDVELPPLRPWNPGLTVGDGPEGPALSFTPAPPAPEKPPAAELPRYYREDNTQYVVAPLVPEPVVQLHAAGGLLWQEQDPASPWGPGPYVLEDFTGVEAQVRAVSSGTWFFYPLASTGSDLNFRLEWRGPRVPVPGGTRRPVSRGAACSPMPEDGVSGPCPYTDGKLDMVQTRRSPSPDGQYQVREGVESLTFTLDAPVLPRRGVVRGLETSLTFQPQVRVVLEGSADGTTWTPLADVPVTQFDPSDERRTTYGFSLGGSENDSPWDGPLDVFNSILWLDAPLTPGAPVRQVRLSVKADGDLQYTPPELIWALTELSLFE